MFCVGIVFTNINKNGTLPPHVEYKIRMNSTFTQDTTIIRSNYWQPGPECEYQPYYFFGFDWFQDLFDRAIIDEQVNAGSNLAPASYLQEIPYPCYMSDRYVGTHFTQTFSN
jgi:ATP-binding cassette subfamily A (ABC1) protein 2